MSFARGVWVRNKLSIWAMLPYKDLLYCPPPGQLEHEHASVGGPSEGCPSFRHEGDSSVLKTVVILLVTLQHSIKKYIVV